MMLRFFGGLVLVCASISGMAQNALKVETYKLNNGFTVFLNEDPSAVNVFGAVMVNAGSKDEYPDATGMAHYLEHLLFKGTTTMGTTNYTSEKPYIDSIVFLYDRLAETADADKKLAIQKQINELAVKASQYGLPNEFDKLVRNIGGTGMNAFTSTDMTFYHNSFPAHEINRWLDLYAARFQNPVFRSFQSELEVVYEEKNRGMDNFTWRIFEKFQSELFPNHPYGQWTTIGKTEHLKNPQLSKMYAFFNRFYVPENMALILSGNFDAASVKEIIRQKFGSWENKGFKKEKLPAPSPISGVRTVNVNYTPVKVGLIGFQTVPQNHPDRIALTVAENLLFNETETGYLNKLQRNREIMFCGAFSLPYTDAGASFLFFVPKLFSQSFKVAENKVMGGYNYLKNGTFTDEELRAVKNGLAKTFQQELESVSDRGVMIGSAFNAGISWEEHLQYPERVEAVTREEIMRVANTYFGANYVRLVSSTGFGKNEKLQKPPFKAVVTEQNGKSEYAEAFEKIEPLPFRPRFIDFGKDVNKAEWNGHKVYGVKNPVNDLFYLDIRFNVGKLGLPKLEIAANFINYCGAGSYSLEALKTEFAALGCVYSISCSDNELNVSVEGREEALPKALKLIKLVMDSPIADSKSKSLLIDEHTTNRKFEKRSPDFMGRALMSYAVHNKNAEYFRRESLSNISKGKESEWISLFKDVVHSYSTHISYTGQRTANDVAELLKTLGLATEPKADFRYEEGMAVAENTIYFVNDKNAVQSQLYFYVPGEQTDTKDYPQVTAFNEYFAGGFSGLLMQEIREYRSLAYATGGRYAAAPIVGKKGRLVTYIGCQADKTVEAVDIMISLIGNMPLKQDRFADLAAALRIEAGTSYPEFTELADKVFHLQQRGYTDDPNRNAYTQYETLTDQSVQQFYERFVKSKSYVITVYGDKKRVDLEKLKKFGKIVELKTKDFVVF